MNTKLPQHLINVLYAWLDGRHDLGNELIQQPKNTEIILKLAKGGDGYAQYLAGMYYFLRDDSKSGLDFLAKSGDNENFEPSIVTVLGLFIAYFIDGEPDDFEMTHEIVRVLEKSEYSASHTLLGVICSIGYGGVQLNSKRAIYEYEKSFMLNKGINSASEQAIINNLLNGSAPIEKVLDYFSDETEGTDNADKVVELCEEWLSRDNVNYTLANVYLGEAYCKLGRYRKALQCYLDKNNTEHALLYTLIADMYLEDKIALDNAIVEGYMRRALEIKSQQADADEDSIAVCQERLNDIIARGKEELNGIIHTVQDEMPEILSKSSEPTVAVCKDCYCDIVIVPIGSDVNSESYSQETTCRINKKLGKAQIAAVVVAPLLTVGAIILSRLRIYTLHGLPQTLIVMALLIIAGAIIGITASCEYRNYGKSFQFNTLLFAVGIPIAAVNLLAIMLGNFNRFMQSSDSLTIMSIVITSLAPLLSCIWHYFTCHILSNKFSKKVAVGLSYVSVVIAIVGVAIAVFYFCMKIVFAIFGSGNNSTSSSGNSNCQSDGRQTYTNGYYVRGETLYNASGKVVGKKYYSYENKFYDRDRKLVGEINGLDSLELYKK